MPLGVLLSLLLLLRGAEPMAGAYLLPVPVVCAPAHRTSEKLVKAPREGCATGPSGHNCLLCMCALDIDTAGTCRAFLECCGGWLFGCPRSLSPSLLQTVPRPSVLSPPHMSPRCCLLRLRCLPHPAVVQGRVRPRATTGVLAGGKTLPVSCPVGGWRGQEDWP